MLRRLRNSARTISDYLRLPSAAKAEHRLDRFGLPPNDPGIQQAIEEAVGWLCRAQDHSTSHDGGVARHFSLLSGWGTSYPETTGYIIPTLLSCARLFEDEALRQRAKMMLDWLLSIQFPNGGFQGGPIGAQPLVPVSFNTGQILFGLAAGVREFGAYGDALCLAANWLIATQDDDGCWRRYPSPFVMPGDKAYDTHIAWGLLEAARVTTERRYIDSAIANVRWALSLKRENGWFDLCCTREPSQPSTHTLGYALRGIIEAYQFTNDATFLKAAVEIADGLLTGLREDGLLPGCLRSDWRAAVPWACLTGSAQVAICWLSLYGIVGDVRYREAGYASNRYVRRTLKVHGPPETRGGIKGSFPVYGGYESDEYPNWAAKFFIDANLLEKEIRGL